MALIVRTPEQIAAAAAEAEAESARANARAYLAETDWYLVRFAETGVPVPVDVATARATARAVL